MLEAAAGRDCARGRALHVTAFIIISSGRDCVLIPYTLAIPSRLLLASDSC